MIWKKPTAGVVLAAGMSTRLGRPKQLLEIKGRHLLEWVLDAALQSELKRVILVLGHESRTILQALGRTAHHPDLQVVLNRKYREGLSHSLRAGLLKARETCPSVMFLLADQPMVSSKTIDYLLARFWESDKDICVPVHEGKRGNPTIFSSRLYSELMSVQGDVGARKIIEENPDRVLFVEIEDPLCFLDIDSEEDIKRLFPSLA